MTRLFGGRTVGILAQATTYSPFNMRIPRALATAFASARALAALLTFALALSLSLASCSGRGGIDLSRIPDVGALKAEIAPFPAKQAKKLRIGVMPDAGILPLYLMDNVEPITFQSALERDAALDGGTLDGISGDLVTVIARQQKGIELRAVTLTESRFLLIAGPKFRESAKDSSGAPLHWNVAISENTVVEYITDSLAAAKLGKAEILLDKISVPQVPVRLEMLRNGQVPLACLTDVMAWNLLSNGFRIVRDQAGSDLEPAVIALTGTVLKKRAPDVAAFREKWNAAVALINAEPGRYEPLLLEKARLPESDYPVPHYRAITLPTKAQAQSVIDWYADKYGLERPAAYEDLVAGK